MSTSFDCGTGSFGRRPDERGKGKHIVLTPVPNWHLDKHGGNMGVEVTPATVFHSCVWLTHITPNPCPWVLTHSVSLYLVLEQKHVSTDTHTQTAPFYLIKWFIYCFFFFFIYCRCETEDTHVTYISSLQAQVRPPFSCSVIGVCVSCLRTRQRQRHRHR